MDSKNMCSKLTSYVRFIYDCSTRFQDMLIVSQLRQVCLMVLSPWITLSKRQAFAKAPFVEGDSPFWVYEQIDGRNRTLIIVVQKEDSFAP